MRKDKQELVITIQPIGGLGQIGSNSTIISTPNHRIMIDCGILFPQDDLFDLNYLIPDYSLLEDISDLIITHGHEDHIGAIVHLLQAFPHIRVWAPGFASVLIRDKLNYRNITHPITIYKRNTIIPFDNFEIYPIAVNHSIPDSYGLIIKDQENQLSLLYISDFKYDDRSNYEAAIDLKKIESLMSTSAKRMLMADSTNLSTSETSLLESDLIPDLSRIIAQRERRIFITLFASNIQRVQNIIHCCQQAGKRLVLAGRSLKKYIDAACERDLLQGFEGVFQDYDSTKPGDTNIVVLVAGCQGDFRSALRRIVTGSDSLFKPSKGDLFLFSSKAIPGNEKKISLLLNQLYQAGCEVITGADATVHASGHPSHDDLLTLYKTVMPTDFIPVHGEARHLHLHRDFFLKNYPDAEAHLLYNFDQISLDRTLSWSILKELDPPQPILIHGKDLPIERTMINQRRKIATAGAIFITLANHLGPSNQWEIFSDLIGLPEELQQQQDKLERIIFRVAQEEKGREVGKKSDTIRIAVRRFAANITGYKPQTYVHLT
jgi:ribonuclease J